MGTQTPAERRSWKVPCESSELVPSESFDKSKRGVNLHLLHTCSTPAHANNDELMCVRSAFLWPWSIARSANSTRTGYPLD
jgi:hypothetical protein